MLSIGLNLWQWIFASKGPAPPGTETDYVAETAGVLVAEDGATQYVTEG